MKREGAGSEGFEGFELEGKDTHSVPRETKSLTL